MNVENMFYQSIRKSLTSHILLLPQMESLLYTWINDQRRKRTLLSESHIVSKGGSLYNGLKGKNA